MTPTFKCGAHCHPSLRKPLSGTETAIVWREEQVLANAVLACYKRGADTPVAESLVDPSCPECWSGVVRLADGDTLQVKHDPFAVCPCFASSCLLSLFFFPQLGPRKG